MGPLRISIIAIMAFVILGISPLLGSGQFIMPYGLFKPTFFIILVIGLIVQKKKVRFSEATAFVWTLGLALSSKFIFDIFWDNNMTEEKIRFYYSFHDLANLVTYVFLLLWMLLIAWKEKGSWSVLQVIGAVGFFVCLLLNAFEWTILPATIWFGGMLMMKNRHTVDYALAVFLYFVVASTWLSAYFFGMDTILIQL